MVCIKRMMELNHLVRPLVAGCCHFYLVPLLDSGTRFVGPFYKMSM